jgi:hypothetical protein
MKKDITKMQSENKFEGYENARMFKDIKNPEPSSEKSVKAATNRLNPDEDSKDRG